jgi:hypothetical protein
VDYQEPKHYRNPTNTKKRRTEQATVIPLVNGNEWIFWVYTQLAVPAPPAYISDIGS